MPLLATLQLATRLHAGQLPHADQPWSDPLRQIFIAPSALRSAEELGGARFDAAYKCAMQCANASHWANGYRTSTSQPVLHQTAIQSPTLTTRVDAKAMVVLDTLSKRRNVSDWGGAPIRPASVD